jgi:hypothetical protein
LDLSGPYRGEEHPVDRHRLGDSLEVVGAFGVEAEALPDAEVTNGIRDVLIGLIDAETNDAMIPSPVCLTSRPPRSANAARTISS